MSHDPELLAIDSRSSQDEDTSRNCRPQSLPGSPLPWIKAMAPHIHAHRGKTVVVAISGSVFDDGSLNGLVQDLALMNAVGVRTVLVHGIEPQLNRELVARGHFAAAHGPVIDEAAMACAHEVSGRLRYQIEAAFSQGMMNTPMAHSNVKLLSGNFVVARPAGIVDGVDLRHSGVVRRVDAKALERVLDLGAVALISPVGFSPIGETFSVRMEDVATSTALTLEADSLMFVSEAFPELGNDAGLEMATKLSLVEARAELRRLPPNRHHSSDFHHCLKYGIQACEGGVARVHIVSSRVDGAVLMEAFAQERVGTLLTNERLNDTRQANLEDIPGILRLIEPYQRDGTLVRRDRVDLERNIDAFSVLSHDGSIIGCAALHPYADRGTGEMATLTVSEHAQGRGGGEKLLRSVEAHARALGLRSVFVLTTRTSHWFRKHGFVPVSIEWLPEVRLRTYNWDRRSVVLVKQFGSA